MTHHHTEIYYLFFISEFIFIDFNLIGLLIEPIHVRRFQRISDHR